jgi:hypothetical protein
MTIAISFFGKEDQYVKKNSAEGDHGTLSAGPQERHALGHALGSIALHN